MDHPHIFISAAEPSADLHAASLIRAITALEPRATFTGVAGPKMQQSGCKSIYDMTAHSSMIMAIFGHVHHGFKMLSLTRQEISNNRYHAAVVIDSPILNGRIAKIAKNNGLPVLYYIAPQLWAWGGNIRIRWVRRWVDRVACILPFEEAYFRSYGLEASYVGHPLFAALTGQQVDQESIRRYRASDRLVLAVMPGSRRHVAIENFPSQVKVAAELVRRFPNLHVLVSVANPQVKPILVEGIRGANFSIELQENRNAEILKAADLALVVSGTATLEAAFHHTPMIVMYNTTPLYDLVSWAFSTEYFSLPNILAGWELVPEFVPYYKSITPIIEQAAGLLSEPLARQQMSKQLEQLVESFVNTAASDTTAKILLDMIETHRPKTESVTITA